MKYEATPHKRLEVGGTPFVYGSATAAIVALDAVADEALASFAAPGGIELEAWLAEGGASRREAFEELVRMRLVRPLGERGPALDPLPPMPYPLATVVLNVSNKCNLACTYCYEFGDDRLTSPSASRKPRMDAETARKAIDLLFDGPASRAEVSVTFFGGETLLNFDTIRSATLHAKARASQLRRRVSFSLTTNATLLDDEIVAFLVEHDFGVNVSIDGARGEHDKHRTFRSGRGSYDAILPRIRKLLDAKRGRGRPVGARVTLTHGLGDVRGTFEHLTREVGFAHVGFAPVTSSQDRDWALDNGEYGRLLAGFRSLAEDYVAAAREGRSTGFSNLEDLLAELHRGANKAHPCGAGLGLVGVSTEGELGLCHRFVESGEHALGDVEHGIDEARRREFLERGHISKKIACHECFARPHCSGGCYHEAYVRYRDASAPNLHYCEWVRAWTELGLECYARIALENPAFLARFDSRGGAPAALLAAAEASQ
jgi:uncharacterized protein